MALVQPSRAVLLGGRSPCRFGTEGSQFLGVGRILPGHSKAQARVDGAGITWSGYAALVVSADASRRSPERPRSRAVGAMDRGPAVRPREGTVGEMMTGMN